MLLTNLKNHDAKIPEFDLCCMTSEEIDAKIERTFASSNLKEKIDLAHAALDAAKRVKCTHESYHNCDEEIRLVLIAAATNEETITALQRDHYFTHEIAHAAMAHPGWLTAAMIGRWLYPKIVDFDEMCVGSLVAAALIPNDDSFVCERVWAMCAAVRVGKLDPAKSYQSIELMVRRVAEDMKYLNTDNDRDCMRKCVAMSSVAGGEFSSYAVNEILVAIQSIPDSGYRSSANAGFAYDFITCVRDKYTNGSARVKMLSDVLNKKMHALSISLDM